MVEREPGILSWSPQTQRALAMSPWASHLPPWSFREPVCKTTVTTKASTDGGHDHELYVHRSFRPHTHYTHSVHSYPILQRKLRQRDNNIQPSILVKTTSSKFKTHCTALRSLLALTFLSLVAPTQFCSCLVIVSDSFATPCTVAYQAPLSLGFPKQEHWNGLPCPSPEEPS